MRAFRGSILTVTLGFTLVFTMLGAASIYISTLHNETQSKQILAHKAFWLAEAGAQHALWALRRRINTDLRSSVEGDNPNDVNALMLNYFNNQNAAGLLSNYGNLNFSEGEASFNVTSSVPLDLGDGIQGNYSATVTIFPQILALNPDNPSTNAYNFSYGYSVTSTATLINIGAQKIINLNNGSFSVIVQRDNFAKYALFTNSHRMEDGTTVWFTANTVFEGPLHTNDRFSFAYNPSGRFKGEVTQYEQTARFRNNGNSRLLDADRNGNIDVPVFEQSFKRGQPKIIIPATTSQAYMKSKALGGMVEPSVNGIYLPNDGQNITGGVFIKGNATVNMAMSAGNPVYTITQGMTASTVSVDYSSNTTTYNGITYSGIPDGHGQTDEGALIYSKNSITGLSGMVQQDSVVTVASEGDLVITGNILYEKNPTLAGNEGYDNLLGVISWNGNVRIGNSAPNNITIHGVIMAPNGVFTVDNYDSGSPRGVATLLGGVITDKYGAFFQFDRNGNLIHGYGRNFIYDERMLQGYSPIYFPFMPNFTAISSGIGSSLTWQEG